MNPRLAIKTIVWSILVMVSSWLYTKPYYNWDILPYMVLVHPGAHHLNDSTLQAMYIEVSEEMPVQDLKALRELHPELTDHAHTFAPILKYFETKPLYNLANSCLYKTGVSLPRSTSLPSAVSYLVIMIVLFLWLSAIIPLPLAALSTLAIGSCSFLIASARLSSPDMLAAAFIFSGLYIASQHFVLGGTLLAGLAILVRPDSILFLIPVLFFLYKSGKLNLTLAGLITFAGVCMALILVRPGLLIEFLFTTSDYSSSWSTIQSFRNYSSGLSAGISSVFKTSLPYFMFLGLISFYPILKKNQASGNWSALIITTLVFILFRYFLHPVMEDRFLIPAYLIIVIGAANTFQSWIKNDTRKAQKT